MSRNVPDGRFMPPAADGEDPLADWEEGDQFSFEDSDRFEEDSLCSWSSEPESVCNNWRGWKRPNTSIGPNSNSSRRNNVLHADIAAKVSTSTVTEQEKKDGPVVPSLTDLAARCVAAFIPFELVETVYPPVPEQLQLQIAFWSFPENEEDIRLYSCLANGSADEFTKGDWFYKTKNVTDALQIGFHLSATVVQPGSHNVPNVQDANPSREFNVAVTFDRGRITSCNCTCNSSAYWCSHVVAVCLHRIFQPGQVRLRAPVSESLSRLHKDQLQKFAQYLISELPQQILPTAQRLLDMLLSHHPTPINTVCGAPDPTAGASATDQTSWYLDEKTLHDNIKKILIKFCVPAPIVFSDVNYLGTTAPPAAAEWSSLLRPLRGREPEGMWNLLSIVREMFKRCDHNAVSLLEIVTQECLACEQIMIWWFNTKAALHNGASGHLGKASVNSSSHASQHACSSLCDEIVVLWRLAALNPAISPEERENFYQQFCQWHLKIIDKVTKSRVTNNASLGNRSAANFKSDVESFTGFKPAIEACQLSWDDYPIPGVTFTPESRLYHHTTYLKQGDGSAETNQVASSSTAINCGTRFNSNYFAFKKPIRETRNASYMNFVLVGKNGEATVDALLPSAENRSSISSEGFCENDADVDVLNINPSNQQDPDEVSEGSSSRGQASGSGIQQASDWSDSEQSAKQEKKSDVPKLEGEIENSPANPIPSTSAEFPSTSAGPSTSTGAIPKNLKSLSDTAPPLSPNEKWDSSNSDSQQSGDEYNVYFYEPQFDKKASLATDKNATDEERKNEPAVFANVRCIDDPWEILFARAEALHAHGQSKESCHLAIKLALELLANPPDLMQEVPTPVSFKGKKRKINPLQHQITLLASATLAKCAFLCAVLSESPDYHYLAFKVGMFALEMARPPASTKSYEVKLANQETDIVQLLKKIPLGYQEVNILREKAEMLRNGSPSSRGEALLPIMLASFLFESLCLAINRDKSIPTTHRIDTDIGLGFDAAVAALGLKTNVSEADHPLLCEGIRRQRGDLALTMLTHYKDNPEKLARIMEKLLDREVHQLTKVPLVPSYYSSNPPTVPQSQFGRNNVNRHGLGNHNCRAMTWVRMMPGMRGDEGADVGMAPGGLNDMSENMMGAGSRPHSSTSADLEQTMNALVIDRPQGNMICTPRGKERYKKRPYPSIPNQPSEAGAHFMNELAKTVLTKAGGTSSTSLFTQATAAQNHLGPHRALHMCALQLGLYALGLHNFVTPNWLSRTYSTHVSWITGQAMEIGAPAISFLIDSWEGHLTPPEAASIADRASRGCDPNMVRAAAELALSVLPHAHALNPNEISRAILQCKEQSDAMLEQSCLTVENAAKGGGVYPEVLFQVSKYWYELFLHHSPPGTDDTEAHLENLEQGFNFQDPNAVEMMQPNVTAPPQVPGVATASPATVTLTSLQSIPYNPGVFQFTGVPNVPRVPMHMYNTNMPVNSFSTAFQCQYALTCPPTYTMQYFQAPVNLIPNNNAANIRASPHPHPMFGMHIAPQVRPPAPPPTPRLNAVQPPIVPMQPVTPQRPPMNLPQSLPQTNAQQVPNMANPAQANGMPNQPPQQQYSSTQLKYLLAAYRVGMLALEVLARRIHDDRPQAKYARNPPYGDDVKWLFKISKKLGTNYLHHYCVCALNSVVSPFVLHEIAFDAAVYLSRNNNNLIVHHLRTTLTPLVQKCQQMYIQCMHQKLYHLTTADYEEFVNIVLSARLAFVLTPDGGAQFKEWLQSIRRSKSCKKDLWTQINAALANSK